MSNRGMDAPLAVQMDRLKKSMNSRDKRRDQDRQQRLVSTARDDPYAQTTQARPSAGGVNLGPGAAAQAAVANAAALEGPQLIRCEVCQANFRNEAMLRQHQAGPAHKKAVARDKAQKEREAWMENPSAAANALQAAGWLNGEGLLNKQPPSRGGAQRYHKQPGRGRGQTSTAPAPQPAELPARSQGPSHAELIAQARKMNEPISINGWIPPSLEASAQPAHDDEREDSDSEEAEEGLVLPSETERLEGAGQQADAPNAHAKDKERTENIGGRDVHEDAGIGLVAYADSSDAESSGGESDKPKTTFESFF